MSFKEAILKSQQAYPKYVVEDDHIYKKFTSEDKEVRKLFVPNVNRFPLVQTLYVSILQSDRTVSSPVFPGNDDTMGGNGSSQITYNLVRRLFSDKIAAYNTHYNGLVDIITGVIVKMNS